MTAEHKLSNKEIARLTGISVPHVGRVFRGERDPSWATACKMADVMDITLDELRRLLPRDGT